MDKKLLKIPEKVSNVEQNFPLVRSELKKSGFPTEDKVILHFNKLEYQKRADMWGCVMDPSSVEVHKWSSRINWETLNYLGLSTRLSQISSLDWKKFKNLRHFALNLIEEGRFSEL